jgi:hypothetical protein
MSDDGSGAGLRVPSVMISKDDGEYIKKYMKGEKAGVELNIQFQLSENKPEDGVN